ncbi:MAG: hypothetical protein GF383_06785 [Candidatus Lokiarchaeota archaeon]|nr:hypothetical protein [Candidatus Lokiarchaeota archaeon]MBD3339827.1 hypothetical protein [Candidatus Lokiarchaeota archaeon]
MTQHTYKKLIDELKNQVNSDELSDTQLKELAFELRELTHLVSLKVDMDLFEITEEETESVEFHETEFECQIEEDSDYALYREDLD